MQDHILLRVGGVDALYSNPFEKWENIRVREDFYKCNHLSSIIIADQWRGVSAFFTTSTWHYCAHIPAVFVFSVTQTLTNTRTSSFKRYPGQFNAAGGSARKDWVSGPLDWRFSKIGRTDCHNKTGCLFVVEHHRRTSQRTYLEPPVLSCYPPVFFLKSKLQVILFLKIIPWKSILGGRVLFRGNFCIIAKVAMIQKKI